MSYTFGDMPARLPSQRGYLTAVMGPVPDNASAREQSGITAGLTATEIANLIMDGEISRIISNACSQEGELNNLFQDKINASRDEFAAQLTDMEEILDSTVIAVNEERDHLRAAAGDDEELLEAINLSFAVADEEAGENEQPGEDRRADNAGRDQRARLIAETRIYQDDLGRGGRLSMKQILTTVVGNVLQAAGPLIGGMLSKTSDETSSQVKLAASKKEFDDCVSDLIEIYDEMAAARAGVLTLQQKNVNAKTELRQLRMTYHVSELRHICH
jgi:hypothetical protein